MVLEDGLGDEFIHAHTQSSLFELPVTVCCDAADARLGSLLGEEAANLLRADSTIHARHAIVHHDEAVHGMAALKSCLDHLESFEAI